MFGSTDPRSGTERQVAVAETRIGDSDERRVLSSRINEIIADLSDIPPDDIVLAPPGTVLKTSSGKLLWGRLQGALLKRGDRQGAQGVGAFRRNGAVGGAAHL